MAVVTQVSDVAHGPLVYFYLCYFNQQSNTKSTSSQLILRLQPLRYDKNLNYYLIQFEKIIIYIYLYFIYTYIQSQNLINYLIYMYLLTHMIHENIFFEFVFRFFSWNIVTFYYQTPAVNCDFQFVSHYRYTDQSISLTFLRTLEVQWPVGGSRGLKMILPMSFKQNLHLMYVTVLDNQRWRCIIWSKV